jgi:hypothetical protein
MRYLILVMLLGSSYSTNAQLSDCKDQLISIVRSMQGIDRPAIGRTHFLAFDIQSTARNAPTSVSNISNTSISISITTEKYSYESDYISMFVDEKDQFIIIHPKKLILKKKNPEGVDRIDFRKEILSTFQDSILKYGEVFICDKFKGGIHNISIRPPDNLRKSLQINKIEYVIDITNNTLKEVTVFYIAPHKLKKQKVTYKEIGLNIPSKRLNWIFDHRGLLKAEYKSYQLINQSN